MKNLNLKNQNTKHKIPNTKQNKGITLVALIITIIVLLILAVVAISAVNNTGIIQHAQNSADEYTDKRDQENVMVGNYLDIINHYKPGEKTQVGEILSQIREGDVWQNVTFSSNISNAGITIPETVIGYSREENPEPYNVTLEGYTQFAVIDDNEVDGWFITYYENTANQLGEVGTCIELMQLLNEEVVNIYEYYFVSENYTTNVLYKYDISTENITEHEGDIIFTGTVISMEEKTGSTNGGNKEYYYNLPILEGMETWFTGTVNYAQ